MSDQDHHDIDYVVGAVLAQIEDLGLHDRIKVMRAVMDNLVVVKEVTSKVLVPGDLVADYRHSGIVGWTFTPHAAVAGYFGPAAMLRDGDDELDIESTNGPFWRAVQDHLRPTGAMIVSWEE